MTTTEASSSRRVAPPRPLHRDAQDLGLQEILDLQRAAVLRDGIPSAAVRQDRIARLQQLLVDNVDELAEALRADFGSRAFDLSLSTDLVVTAKSLSHDRSHVAEWMRPRRTGNPLTRPVFRGEVHPVPKGVVGVLGPWNFPLNLVVLPAGAAFAAGNRVMIRPSEITGRTTAAFARLAGDYFDVEELAVITEVHGDGADFAGLRFDHLFFTGSPQVGALVAEAAGRNLVPTTLELGGKNPVVVDRSADIETAARRVAAARMVNGGQVCLCPDYVYVPRHQAERFTETVLDEWRSRYPSITHNDEFTSLIDDRNYNRVVALIEDAVAQGAIGRSHVPETEGLPDRASRKVPPTLLTGVTPSMRVAQEEVFGPVLTVYAYDELDEPIDHINTEDSPLTLYWFGRRNKTFASLVARTRSGSVNANDFAANLLSPDLPFGGVGRSGTGYYHGRYGFDTFSHLRAIAFSRLPFSLGGLLNPPYTSSKKRINSAQLRQLRRSLGRLRSVSYGGRGMTRP
ncbi:aldehyde dehydrogenase family protein [Nocardioides sp. NPDC058538]|uniref:aldehyde dehydrogenase family protein n=1 Tax=Nocardioides sp. NPDC058538 TaxID=3346542 RepID=UPI003669B927